jgi:hypothetical protein
MKISRTFRGLLVAAAVFALTACASTPSGQRAERIVVQAAVLHVIERSSIPSAKAQAIVGAVKLVHTLLLDDNASVSALRSALLSRVAERDLPPAEKLVALEVVNALSDEVERRVGSGILSPDAVLTVNTVLDWVLDATALYVPHTPDT